MLREVKQLAHGHTARKKLDWYSNLSLPDPKPHDHPIGYQTISWQPEAGGCVKWW